MNFNNRLKDYVIDILLNEESVEAWEMLKTMQPSCKDLDRVITNTKFKDEAWELFKQSTPTVDEIVDVIYSEKENEAIAFLLENYIVDNDTLERILSNKGNDAIARVLLNQNPDKDQLIKILRYTNLADEVAKELLKLEMDNDELIDIIIESNLKEQAWNQLLLQHPDISDLKRIVNYSDLYEAAWKQLLKLNPSNELLMDFVNDYSDTGRKKQEAARIILNQTPSISDLTTLIETDQLADEALEMLRSKAVKPHHLERIIKWGKDKVNDVAELSMQLNPSKEQLLEIFEYSDRKDEATTLLVKKRLTIDELTTIVLGSNNLTALEMLSKKVKFDRSKVDEKQLVKEITSILFQNPDLLDVNNWHNEEKHCFGGWAITLNKAAQKVEKEFSSEIAACLLLPNYTHLFYVDKETVLQALKNI